MLPEIRLLHEKFEGREWSRQTQEDYMDQLAASAFFEGKGSPSHKAFGARDRINRSPKALGLVDLSPVVALTEAGNALLYGKRPQEVFLRQLLKFQLPSPYHIESKEITGTYYVRPYLEMMRLVRELEYLTFDELKIYAVQLTDYRNFDIVKSQIIAFRQEKEKRKGAYKQLVFEKWTEAILQIYQDTIADGKTKTRETADASLNRFIATKKNNLRDYADACFRYLRYTGLVSIAHKNKTISFFPDKVAEVDYLLATVERAPVFIDDIEQYKKHLFTSAEPALYVDQKENIIETLMQTGPYTRRELTGKTIEQLKDLRDNIIQQRADAVIQGQVAELKSYARYAEILDTFNGILSKAYYDAPLMFEYNTWRALTMLGGGTVKGNFKFDDAGQPLSTAPGNMPDIECDYENFALSVEVTLQSGQRQYESEGEPVARHYGQMRKRTGKDSYCLFIAPTINDAAFAHFFALNQMEIAYYGGKTKIIPLSLAQFVRLIENAYHHSTRATPADIRCLLDLAVGQGRLAANENDWKKQIQICVDHWLTAAAS